MESVAELAPVYPDTVLGATRDVPSGRGGAATPHQVEVVVPVYNEAGTLEDGITRLRQYLDTSFPFPTVVTIADNGSTDATALIAQRLASTLDGVRALCLTRKGRGHALRTAWSASTAEVVAYMDVDLSTSLSALLPLVGSVISGHSDLAVGTRLARGARVVRGPKRELISRAYSHIVRMALRSRVGDFQCGFKAIRHDRALQILPLVEDEEWFFDTELVVTAERLGVRVTETPVEWTDDPTTSVHIVTTAANDLRGIWRMARQPRPDSAPAGPVALTTPATADRLLSFAGVGVLSTLSYLFLFALGWRTFGPLAANAAALAFCTVVNTALHHSLARSAPGDARRPSFLAVVVLLYGVSLTATSIAIVLAGALVGPSLVADALAATMASCAASLVRFSLLRGWAFPPPKPRPRAETPGLHALPGR